MLDSLRQNKKILTIAISLLVLLIGVVTFFSISQSPQPGQKESEITQVIDSISKVATDYINKESIFSKQSKVDIDLEFNTETLIIDYPANDMRLFEIYKIGEVTSTKDIYQFPIDFTDSTLSDLVGTTIPDYFVSASNIGETKGQTVLYDKVTGEWELPTTPVRDLRIITINGVVRWYYISDNQVYVSGPNFINPRILEYTPIVEDFLPIELHSDNASTLYLYGTSSARIVNAGIYRFSLDSITGSIDTSSFVSIDAVIEYTISTDLGPLNEEIYEAFEELYEPVEPNQEQESEHIHDDIILPKATITPINNTTVLLKTNYYNTKLFLIEFENNLPKITSFDTFTIPNPGWSGEKCHQTQCYYFDFATTQVYTIDVQSKKIEVDEFKLEGIDSIDYKKLLRTSMYSNLEISKLISIDSTKQNSIGSVAIYDKEYSIVLI